MRLKKLLFITTAIFGLAVNGQTKKLKPELENKWLVTVGGDTITAGDFWYAFVKNADENKPINIDSLNKYKELYDKFLLKVTEAKSLG